MTNDEVAASLKLILHKLLTKGLVLDHALALLDEAAESYPAYYEQGPDVRVQKDTE